VFSAEQVSLSRELARSVVERTEGWPVGIYLAAVIARENDGDLDTITGDDRYVADYLYHESLLRQPEEVRHFLRCTSVLDQLHGPLCDAVLASTGGTEMLRHLESASVFLVPLDRRRQWYRYHALFREFLLGELHRTESEIVEKLHLRATDWYAANATPSLALEHLLQTRDRNRASRLTAELCVPTYQAGQISTTLRWLATLGDASIQAYPHSL
jgi:LuxR family maltose regulon positive regulatory protein